VRYARLPQPGDSHTELILQLFLDGGFDSCRRCRDRNTSPVFYSEETLGLQKPICPRYCVQVNAEVTRQLAYRGQWCPGSQCPGCDKLSYLAGDLFVHRIFEATTPKRSFHPTQYIPELTNFSHLSQSCGG